MIIQFEGRKYYPFTDLKHEIVNGNYYEFYYAECDDDIPDKIGNNSIYKIGWCGLKRELTDVDYCVYYGNGGNF